MTTSAVKLPFHDAYAIRRALSRLTLDGVYVSPGVRLLLDSFGDLTDKAAYTHFSTFIGQQRDIIEQIMPIDPQAEYDEMATRFINANDLKDLTTPKYMLSDYPFYDYALNMLVGPSGGGKSFVALDFAAETAAKLTSGNVGYIAAEGLHGYASRWEAWKKFNQVETDRLIFYPDPVNFIDDTAVTAFINQARKEMVRLIIVDTVARCMAGADENSTKDMGIFISQIDRARKELDCGVLLVHHTGKDGTTRGSSALYGACDSVAFLSRNEIYIAVHNEHDKGGKNKYQQEAATRTFKLLPVNVTLKGEDVSSAVLVESELVMDAPTHSLTSNQRLILTALQPYDAGLPAREIKQGTGLAHSTFFHAANALVRSNLISRIDENYIITGDGKDALGAS
jgi:hypothetical protein